MVLHRTCPGCRRVGGGCCPHCLQSAQPVGRILGLTDLETVAALYRYDGPVRRLVLAAKNGGRRDVLAGFGGPLANLTMEWGSGPFRSSSPTRCGSPGFDVVTWVPASAQGARRRGYDQGRILARSVARKLRLPCRHLLVRRRGSPQTGRSRIGRGDGPALRAPATVNGRILVVDDVITTGGSLKTAGVALRSSGATSVAAVAIAWNASAPEAQAGRPFGAGPGAPS